MDYDFSSTNRMSAFLEPIGLPTAVFMVVNSYCQ